MARNVALLRGINVGGKNKVAMADLRELFVGLGGTDVETYIQSGNVVFAGVLDPAEIEAAVREGFGLDLRVIVRTHDELARAVAGNPFPDADPKALHVGFLAGDPPDVELELEPFHPEDAVVRGRELYLHLPNGVGRSKLPAYVDRQLRTPTTVRNWRTVATLLDLTGR
jgi:uncharacterized protein (DUF1697 family)